MQQIRDPFALRILAKRADDRSRHARIDSNALCPHPDSLHRQVVAPDRPFGEYIRHAGDEAERQQ